MSVILLNTFCTAGMLIKNTGRTVVAKETSRWHADSSSFSCTCKRGHMVRLPSNSAAQSHAVCHWWQHTKLLLSGLASKIVYIFFIVKVVKHWNSFPRKVVDALCPSVLNRHLDNVLNNML